MEIHLFAVNQRLSNKLHRQTHVNLLLVVPTQYVETLETRLLALVYQR